MQKWEYKLWNLEDVSDVPEEAMNIPGHFERKFEQLGLEGWELVWVTRRNDAIFKRPAKEKSLAEARLRIEKMALESP